MGMLRILSEASLKRIPIACHGSEKRRVAQVAVTPFHLPHAALIAYLPWETTFSRIDITVFIKKTILSTSGISHFAARFSFPLFWLLCFWEFHKTLKRVHHFDKFINEKWSKFYNRFRFFFSSFSLLRFEGVQQNRIRVLFSVCMVFLENTKR